MMLYIPCDSRTTAYEIQEKLSHKIPKWLTKYAHVGPTDYVVVGALIPGERDYHVRCDCQYWEKLDGSWDIAEWSNPKTSFKEIYARYHVLKSLVDNPNVL